MKNENSLRALNIIHKALLMGQIMFAAFCLYLVYSKTVLPGMEDMDRTLQVIAIVLTAAGFLIGVSFFKKKLLALRSMDAPLKEKLAMYRAACIIQWAFLEGPSLFCIIGFFLTGNYAFLFLSGTIMILFAMLAPSKIKVAFQIGVSPEELEAL